MFQVLKGLVASSALAGALCLGTVPALADGDSSADASGWTQRVQASQGVVVRVPVNDRGEELTSAATARLSDSTSTNGPAIKAAYEHGTDLSTVARFSDTSTSRDSSTWGWYSWNYDYGWRSNYYYDSYRPYYTYGGNYWSYGNPYSYSYYYPSSYYWGYNYYYYPRYW
jgi:hypothetical protein